MLPSIVPMQAENGNRELVHVFGYHRYSYYLSHYQLTYTAIVDCINLIRPVMVVVDPYWLKTKREISFRFQDINDEADTYTNIKFFTVNGFSI